MKIKHVPYEIDESTNRFHYYENHWKRVCLGLVERHLTPMAGRTLLDYGCGRGETLEMAGRLGMAATGTDADSECVRIAAQHGKTVLLDIANPVGQFGGKSFDVVMCTHVLEHVENPKQVLATLAKLAREYVVVAVPNARYLHLIHQRKITLAGINEGHLQAWDHLHFLNLAERHCGLRLVEWGYDATILPVASRALVKLFGNRTAIHFETGLFRWMFPFHGISVLGLFRPA